jgi:hypothetical protein
MFLDFRQGGFKVAGRTLFLFAAPVITSLTLISIYWWTQGAFKDLWDANVTFAFLYSANYGGGGGSVGDTCPGKLQAI